MSRKTLILGTALAAAVLSAIALMPPSQKSGGMIAHDEKLECPGGQIIVYKGDNQTDRECALNSQCPVALEQADFKPVNAKWEYRDDGDFPPFAHIEMTLQVPDALKESNCNTRMGFCLFTMPSGKSKGAWVNSDGLAQASVKISLNDTTGYCCSVYNRIEGEPLSSDVCHTLVNPYANQENGALPA